MNAAPPQASGPGPAKAGSGGLVIPHKPKWHQRLAAWLIFTSIRAVALTLRYDWPEGSRRFTGPPTGQAIYCVWHNRLALCMIAYRQAQQVNGTPGMAAMVSASKDGGLLAAVLECFRVEPVRGSSSRRGSQALLELTTWAERGYDLAITPDGPRGPRYIVQEGVMSLAQVTGLPIMAFSYKLRWKISVKSWDRFQIPVPFSRCHMEFAAPLRVPREITEAQREELRQRLESSLRALSDD